MYRSRDAQTGVASLIRQLNANAEDVSRLKSGGVQSDPRVALLVLNTYEGTKYSLGTGPLGDGARMASIFKSMSMKVVYLIDPPRRKFTYFLMEYLAKTSSIFLCYYSGHGAQVKDKDGDENDGYDEAMIFVDGYIIDDALIEMIYKHKNKNCRFIGISDCCHSGTIWDLNNKKAPPNCIALSAAKDQQTSLQFQKGDMEYGFFTDCFYDLMQKEKEVTPRELKKQIDSKLRQKKIPQIVVIQTTSSSLLDKPLFGRFSSAQPQQGCPTSSHQRGYPQQTEYSPQTDCLQTPQATQLQISFPQFPQGYPPQADYSQPPPPSQAFPPQAGYPQSEYSQIGFVPGSDGYSVNYGLPQPDFSQPEQGDVQSWEDDGTRGRQWNPDQYY